MAYFQKAESQISFALLSNESIIFFQLKYSLKMPKV